MSWLFALIGLAVGGLSGYLLARRFGDSEQRATTLQKELEQLRQEHAEYRRDVSDHFAKTAVAVNQLTDSYRSVHQQLSDGARALSDNAAAETALAFDQSRLIDAPSGDAPQQPEPDHAGNDVPPSDAPAASPSAKPSPTEPGITPTDVPAEAPAHEADDAVTTPREHVDEVLDSPGGASWTPASADEPEATPQPPRDYAEEHETAQASSSRS